MENQLRRRSFRFAFSLRTLFVVMTILAIWLGWDLQIVRERKAVLSEIERIDALSRVESGQLAMAPSNGPWGNSYEVSLARRILGDESRGMLNLPPSLSSEWITRAEQAFPEAELYIIADIKDHELQYRDSLYTPAAERVPNKGTVFKTGLPPK